MSDGKDSTFFRGGSSTAQADARRSEIDVFLLILVAEIFLLKEVCCMCWEGAEEYIVLPSIL